MKVSQPKEMGQVPFTSGKQCEECNGKTSGNWKQVSWFPTKENLTPTQNIKSC